MFISLLNFAWLCISSLRYWFSLCNFWSSVFNSWFSFSIFAYGPVWVSLLLLFLSFSSHTVVDNFILINFIKDFLCFLCVFHRVQFYFHFDFSSLHFVHKQLWWRNNWFLYSRFKLGAQPGLDGSDRAACLPKIKWLPQTCSVEFFSASWDGVKSLRLILDSHIISRLCPFLWSFVCISYVW